MKRKKVPRAVQAQQQAPKVNPFELKGSRKKFDVLGKRDKGDKKNIIKTREEAVNRVCIQFVSWRWFAAAVDIAATMLPLLLQLLL
jgi:hypothetical protein